MSSSSSLDRARLATAALKLSADARRVEADARAARRAHLEAALAACVDDASRVALVRAHEVEEAAKLRARHAGASEADYEALTVLGRGAFGEVTLVRARAPPHKIYALKKMLKETLLAQGQLLHIATERTALALSTQSKFVVSLHAAWQTPSALFLLQTFAIGGDVMSTMIRIDVFAEDDARVLAAELVVAIKTVHDLRLIHRDIKPDNILLGADGHVRLSDFGLAASFVDDDADASPAGAASDARAGDAPSAPAGAASGRRLLSCVGTPDYLAPEILRKTGHGAAVDVWSLGCVIYEALVGSPPFRSESSVATCAKILRYKEHLVFPSTMSAAARSLLEHLICDADERLTLEQAAAHPFFAGVDWAAVRARTNAVPVLSGVPSPARAAELEALLATLPRSDEAFAPAVRELTSAFDDFDKLPDNDPRKGVASAGAAFGVRGRWPGFTFPPR